MNILALNINTKIEWVTYNELRSNKFTEGEVVIKRRYQKEPINMKYDRFDRFLEEMLYNNNYLDLIIYKIDSSTSKKFIEIIKRIKSFCKERDINSKLIQDDRGLDIIDILKNQLKVDK
jgi:hypothetical protein